MSKPKHTEIERKFLVKSTDFIQQSHEAIPITQAYLCNDPKRVVRVRRAGKANTLTVKGETSIDGTTRSEWERTVSFEDGSMLLALCNPSTFIIKTRYNVRYNGHLFEVDVFADPSIPTIAEVELDSVDEKFDRPDWLGEEVTGDPQYYNSNLCHRAVNEPTTPEPASVDLDLVRADSLSAVEVNIRELNGVALEFAIIRHILSQRPLMIHRSTLRTHYEHGEVIPAPLKDMGFFSQLMIIAHLTIRPWQAVSTNSSHVAFGEWEATSKANFFMNCRGDTPAIAAYRCALLQAHPDGKLYIPAVFATK